MTLKRSGSYNLGWDHPNTDVLDFFLLVEIKTCVENRGANSEGLREKETPAGRFTFPIIKVAARSM